MRAFKVFIFGLLYGWFFKIAFDRIYRENDREDLYRENTSLRDYILSLESQLQQRSLGPNPVAMAQSAPQALPVETPAVRLDAPNPAPTPIPAEKDDLKIIKGIGPAIERKLNNAGIRTFAALAALSRKDLENILGSQIKRLQDENNLIAQAKRLARKR